ncbi:MAG: branched-chain amino acid ABC transporter permease [Pseudomonas sp.]
MTSTNTMPIQQPLKGAFSRHSFGVFDIVLLLVAVCVWFFAPLYLALATNVVIAAILVLSLNLAMGYGGVEALGQAAFYGVGAYASANYALHVSPEPISGLLAGALVAAIVGAISGLAVLRSRGLTQIMLTLTVATLLLEMGQVLRSVTHGDDGLTGYTNSPVLGLFKFGLSGLTSYWYSMAVLILIYLLCRWLVNSPFGLAIQCIRENPLRMRVLGVPVTRHLIVIYTLSAAIAGVAGALSAQVTQTVGLETLSFNVSANAVIMAVIGGVASLYGAFIGAAFFVVASDRSAAVDPANWLLGLGVALILLVRYAPSGIYGTCRDFMLKRRKND